MYKHIIILRHFKTKNNKVNYDNSYEESEAYIKFIYSYIKKHKIKNIIFECSPQDRTWITCLTLYTILRTKSNEYSMELPTVNEILDRDPQKIKKGLINNYYVDKKKQKNDDKTLIIYGTHSSVYQTIFNSVISQYSNSTKIRNEKIHSNSLSFITINKASIQYGFNLNMKKKSENSENNK